MERMKTWANRLQEYFDDPLQRKKMMSKGTHIGMVVFRTLLLVGLCFILLYPILYMLSMSFRPKADIYDPSVLWIPKSLTLDNIRQTIKLLDYGKTIWNSVQVNVFSSLLQLIPCAMMGYSLARFKYTGQKLLFAIVLLTIVIPPQLTIIPLAKTMGIFDFFGIGNIGRLFGNAWTVSLTDTPFAFYVPAILGAGIKAGLFVFIFRQFFRGLPRELEDAAAIDGCGFFQTFVRVIIPNALAVSLTVLILSVVWYWNDYYYSSMFVPNYGTLSLRLTEIPNLYTASQGNIALDMFDVVTLSQSGALLTIWPILLMYIVLQRWFVQGVERSGLVG